MVQRIQTKMCGMTRAEDIAYAAELGVDFVGLIFYLDSPRSITLEHAKAILHSLPEGLKTVAVFVNEEVGMVEKVIKSLPIHYLQFHGDESPNFCEQFNMPYIKAVAASSTAAILNAAEKHNKADALLLDAPSVSVRGGGGKPFDWHIIPEPLDQSIILAGGLNPENVRDAVNGRSIFAVDVCTGVESSPGIKDQHKMKQFVNALGG